MSCRTNSECTYIVIYMINIKNIFDACPKIQFKKLEIKN